MKIIFLPISLLALLLLSSCGSDSRSDSSKLNAVVVFKDASLAAAVRRSLGNPDGELTREILTSLEQLEAIGEGEVTDLSGLEFATNLTVLNISNGKSKTSNRWRN